MSIAKRGWGGEDWWTIKAAVNLKFIHALPSSLFQVFRVIKSIIPTILVDTLIVLNVQSNLLELS